MSSQNIKSFNYFGLSAWVAENCQNCVTSEVERNVFNVLFISDTWTEKMGVPENVFDVVETKQWTTKGHKS